MSKNKNTQRERQTDTETDTDRQTDRQTEEKRREENTLLGKDKHSNTQYVKLEYK